MKQFHHYPDWSNLPRMTEVFMHFQFIVAPPTPALTPPAAPTTEATAELLRQLLDVQREQLTLMQTASVSGGDSNQARWRNFFDRWHEEFPNLPASFREVLPTIERAYIRLMDEMVHHLQDEQSNSLDDDFSLSDFLDRYAIRASQIGTILNLVGQMAEIRTEE
jgi:hypothetical protein